MDSVKLQKKKLKINTIPMLFVFGQKVICAEHREEANVKHEEIANVDLIRVPPSIENVLVTNRILLRTICRGIRFILIYAGKRRNNRIIESAKNY